MKFTREMYLDLMTFGHAPRPMFSELFGPLVGLDREWEQQGATRDEIEMVGFDWDYVPYIDCGGICGALGTPRTADPGGDGGALILRDYLGRRAMLVKWTATLPLPLEFPVRTMDDWLRLKPYFEFSEARIDAEAVERARRRRTRACWCGPRSPAAGTWPAS